LLTKLLKIFFRLRPRFESLPGLLEIADREFKSLRLDGIAVLQAIQSRIRKAKIDDQGAVRE
jgi:hypothetical protein